MKKLLLLAMVTAMVATAAVAQDSKSEAQTKQNHLAWEKKIKTDLGLSAEQSAKWDAVSTEYNTKFETLKKDESNADKDAYKEKKMALKKEKEAKLLEILTPDQQTKYKYLVEKAKSEMKKPS